MSRSALPVHPLYVVAVDGSASAKKAADYAVELANRAGAELRIVTVAVEDDSGSRRRKPAGKRVAAVSKAEAAKALVERERVRARSEGLAASVVVLRGADAAAAIVRHARAEGADLIVVGSRGLTGLRRVLLGSVAAAVVERAGCPVLVVR